MTKLIALRDRGIIKLTGGEVVTFLNNLITNDMAQLEQQTALFAALLSPQGKIVHEFFVVREGEGYLLDLPLSGVPDLIKKLTLYKLRADVEISDVSDEYQVFAVNSGEASLPVTRGIVFVDPRSDLMGQRVIADKAAAAQIIEEFEMGSDEDYLKLRLNADIPEGGFDYALGDCFPHEAGYDLLKAIDFEKGCYVGQEVVSRMEHRGTARKRIVKLVGEEDLPAPGSEVRSSRSLIGVLGSRLAGEGLALARLDRIGAAIGDNEKILVENVAVKVAMPHWADYTV